MERSDSPLGLTPTASLPPTPTSPVVQPDEPAPLARYLELIARHVPLALAVSGSGIGYDALHSLRRDDPLFARLEAEARTYGRLGSAAPIARAMFEGQAHHMADVLLHEAKHAPHARDRIKAAAEALDRGGVGAAPSSLSLTQTNFYLSSLGVSREAPSPAAEAVEPPGQ